MIYLDNAATSFPKPKEVIHAVNECLNKYCGNPGRSSHRLALTAAEKIYETRESVAKFIGVPKCENIIFTPNATYALNLVIKGLINSKCHCIVSDLEHNSVLRPLYKLEEKYGIELSFFDSDLPLNKSVIPLIRNDTKVIICTLCSNVTGKIIDLKELSNIAKTYDLKLILDASQYIGHSTVDLSGINYSAFCTAGHKGLFGIQGSGFAAINDYSLFDTLTEGGSGVDSFSRYMPKLLPERYEAGTLSTPAIVSLGEGIKFLNDRKISVVEQKINYLTGLLTSELESIKGVKLYGSNLGIVSFNFRDLPSSGVASMLDDKSIATRSGFQCSPLIHKKLGTDNTGVIRVSLSYFNTPRDIYALSKALRKI